MIHSTLKSIGTILVLVFIFTSNVTSLQAQCFGPFDGGKSIYLVNPTSGTTNESFSVDGNTIEIINDGIDIIFRVPAGVKVYTDGPDQVAKLDALVDVSDLPGSAFQEGPIDLRLFNITQLAGPFGDGSGGYIGLIFPGGEFGWIEMINCGYKECGVFTFGVQERAKDRPITSDCSPPPPPDPQDVPAIPYWGMLLFGLIITSVLSRYLLVSKSK